MKILSSAGNTSQFLLDVFPQISFFTNRQKSSILANLKFKPIITANPTENFAINFYLEQSTRNMLQKYSKLSSGNSYLSAKIRFSVRSFEAQIFKNLRVIRLFFFLNCFTPVFNNLINSVIQ